MCYTNVMRSKSNLILPVVLYGYIRMYHQLNISSTIQSPHIDLLLESEPQSVLHHYPQSNVRAVIGMYIFFAPRLFVLQHSFSVEPPALFCSTLECHGFPPPPRTNMRERQYPGPRWLFWTWASAHLDYRVLVTQICYFFLFSLFTKDDDDDYPKPLPVGMEAKTSWPWRKLRRSSLKIHLFRN